MTGAIDQLAFTHDIGVSGGSLDEDSKPVSTRPEIASAKASYSKFEQRRREEEERRAKKKKAALENPAFIDDEELLLAAGITPHDHDEDSDDHDESQNKIKTAKVVVQNDPPPIPIDPNNKATNAKGGPSVLPPIINTQYRSSSVKLRRLGSARRKVPRYGIAFAELPQNRAQVKAQSHSPSVANGAIPSEKPSTSSKGEFIDEKRQLDSGETLDQEENANQPKFNNDPSSSDPPSSEPPKDIDEEYREATEVEAGKDQFGLPQQEEATASDQEPKWAEKKPVKRNKVVPTSISVDEAPKQQTIQGPKDDSSVGLQSGTDSTRDEVKARHKKERPKTGVTPQEKMKSWSTDNISGMSTILPWDNEDGDIK